MLPTAHSFDVFDTCLVRVRGRDVDVLTAAAERLVEPAAPDRATRVTDLVRRRQAAEARAARRLGRDAVTLGQIFEAIGDLTPLGVEADALQRAELDVEREGVRPVRAALEQVQAARAAGRRVLFISDTALPAALLRERLEHFGIAEPADPVYASGECGTSKCSGGLFERVLAEQGLQAGELVHSGDDLVSDDAAPLRLGIRVRPLHTGHASRLEALLLSEAPVTHRAATLTAGVARVARTRHAQEAGRSPHAAAVVAAAVAPLFCAYVGWVLAEARRAGLQRLYFVSRDAEVMLAVAERLRRAGDPELRYLYGSRQAWLLAGVDAVDEAALPWLLEPPWALRTPRALLAKLELGPEDVADGLAAARLGPDDVLPDDALSRFWDVLRAAAPLVLERAASAGERVRAYLRQEGFYAPGDWALVDIGWRLSAQRALHRVLAADGQADRLRGFYLGLRHEREPPELTGPALGFLLEDPGLGRPDLHDTWVFAKHSFVEQVFAMASHGSCLTYRRAGDRLEPVLQAADRDPWRREYQLTLHAVATTFAEEARAAGLIDAHADELRTAALVTGRAVVERPTRAEADALGALAVGDDQNETRRRPLAGPLEAGDLVLRLRDRLGVPAARGFDTDHLWFEGSLVLTPPATRAAFRGMRTAERVGRQAALAARRARWDGGARRGRPR